MSARDADLAPYLPRLVRAWSDDDRASRIGILDGSLVSADVSGFTALSERLAAHGREGAEELVRTISAVFDDLISVAERHGGDVVKFRGDALLLLFRDEQHAARACGAAADMQRTIESLAGRETSVGPVELRMACGVHCGAVHLFLTEAPHRELIVAGRAASRVFELEDLAEAGEVMVSAETRAQIDPGWIAGSRDDGLILRPLEPGSSPIPPPEAVTGHDLAAYVPASLRDHLAVASGDAEHRQVTVAFVKAKGTDVADDDPAQLGRKLDLLAARVATVCERYGLTWLESDIDADGVKLYLTAGAPSTTGRNEDAMLRGVRDVVATDIGLTLSAGVNRGRVFTGDIGSETRRTYAVMGDAVNLAARLTARAGPGAALATSDVLDRARTTYATESEPLLVKGKEAAVMAHSVGEPTGTRAVEDTAELVGREAELELLHDALARARVRELRLVEIVADPGVGKSRLVAEARRVAIGFQQLEATGEPYARDEPYGAVREMLRQLVGIVPDASRRQAGAQLSSFVGAVIPDLSQWIPLLALPFDAEVEPTPQAASLDPATSYRRLHETMAALLDRVLLTPTLLVVEDVHWLDDASWGLLAHLVARPAARPWLALSTTRPGGRTLVGDESPATRLELGPLDAAAAAELARTTSDVPLSRETIEALVDRAGGNPLFVRALVLAAAAGEPIDALPETVESLLTALIDTLAPTDRILLRHAAVVGPSFDASLVEEVLGDELEGGSRWEALARFVLPDEEAGYRFRHDLVRVTAYEGLSFERRRQIHGRVGAALEQRGTDGGDHDAALLSLHFHEAGRHEKAWRYATIAGDRAREGFANVVAATLYERALASAEVAGGIASVDVARVAEALGDVCERFGDYERSAAAYSRALTEIEDDRDGIARIGGKLALLEEHAGRYDAAIARYDEALAAVAKDETSATRAELEVGRAGVLFRQARYEECVTWAERAAADAEAADDEVALARSLYLRGTALSHLHQNGIPDLERAIAIFEARDDSVRRAQALNNVGVQHYADGAWGEAGRAYRASREACERTGDVIGAAVAMNNEGEILSDQGRLEEAEPLFEEMVRICRAAGHTLGAFVGLGNLARVAARDGRFDRAYELYDEALAGFEGMGSEWFAIETRARVVECCVLAGAHARALELLDGLADAAAPFTYGGLQALIERLHGYALCQARRPDEGRMHLDESLRLARELDAAYEEGLTLRALADVTGADDPRNASDATLGRLGIVTLPRVPLP